MDEEVEIVDVEGRAALGADDAAGDGLTDSERVTDGEDEVADFEGLTGF